MKKKCAIFCDIDGTLIKYREFSTYKSTKAEPIKNTIKEINRAFNKGHNVILTTARPEYLRFHTLRELNKLNIQYHMLLMSIGRGPRILINDNKNSAYQLHYHGAFSQTLPRWGAANNRHLSIWTI